MSDSPPRKKIFVLDTNVILHDSDSLQQFKHHDVVIPITVLEELDNFKKGNGSINFHAREFLRAIDALSGDRMFDEGVPLGESRGVLRIALDQEFDRGLAFNFRPDKPDHRILNTALVLSRQRDGGGVILVSKDVNLRMKAKAVGLRRARTTPPTRSRDVYSTLYTGKRVLEGRAEVETHRRVLSPRRAASRRRR